MPRVLAEAKSYAERLFDYHTIGHLDGAIAAEALVTPALAEGATWHPDALSHIIEVAGGYPYFLQEYGSVAWNVALGPVRAMAPDAGRHSQSSEVASRLGRPPNSFGPARASLINKGLIYAPEHGQISYTVPGMATFITRQTT